ncbi:hypothetical protein DPEC_G00285390 [Dallia pectoralis]|uniref:Uncharacterized protein n=1 Tax=Dallia pectoralis TaxID=75939 RepID=A0ACC2FJQ4_DALPE|nr:hypothetical protein DPEC_G00285390 [Dallia pectoralis]
METLLVQLFHKQYLGIKSVSVSDWEITTGALATIKRKVVGRNGIATGELDPRDVWSGGGARGAMLSEWALCPRVGALHAPPLTRGTLVERDPSMPGSVGGDAGNWLGGGGVKEDHRNG